MDCGCLFVFSFALYDILRRLANRQVSNFSNLPGVFVVLWNSCKMVNADCKACKIWLLFYNGALDPLRPWGTLEFCLFEFFICSFFLFFSFFSVCLIKKKMNHQSICISFLSWTRQYNFPCNTKLSPGTSSLFVLVATAYLFREFEASRCMSIQFLFLTAVIRFPFSSTGSYLKVRNKMSLEIKI